MHADRDHSEQPEPTVQDDIARAIGDPGSVLPRRDGETVTRWAARAVERVLAPAPCSMTRADPFDFAQCETHDTTFPLGETCKFDGREPWRVYADEADEQRRRAVRAEQRFSLDELAADVRAWHLRELGEGTVLGKVAKVAAEAGELLDDTIKSTEPRPDADAYRVKAHAELADVLLSALGAAPALGIESVERVVLEKWSVVRQRRYLTAPESGVTL